MEIEQEKQGGGGQIVPVLQMLAHTSQHSLVLCTLDFLDKQELTTIAQVALAQRLLTPFFNVAIAKAFLGNYLNRVDRGIFFVFYEDADFRSIETNTINILATKHSDILIPAYTSYRNILQAFRTNTQYLSSQSEFQTLIEQIFLEPDLPMPKLKRQSIGMFCETGFQEYLALARFPPEEFEPWIEEPLEQLREHLAEQLAELTHKLIFSDYGKEEVNRRIREVRFCGYRVNCYNWREYLIEGFKMHNLFVLILAFCSQMVITCKQLLSHIKDPFLKFTEFALRSNIYRNIVLSIEEKLSFLFSNYSQFYSACFQSTAAYPKLNFWRPALSIWVQHMKDLHPSNEFAYNYITSKLRENNLKELLAIKTQKLPSFFSELKRYIDMQSLSEARKKRLYSQDEHYLEMQAFFEDNHEMYQTLAKDYIEYMVDICMNEVNVHWCGHSNHTIKNYPIFAPFMSTILKETEDMYGHVYEVIKSSVPQQIRLNILKEVVKEDLLFSEQRLFKPMIVREMANMVNTFIKEEVAELSQYVVFSQEGYLKHKVSFDFEEKDGLLAYFSKKFNIAEDCSETQNIFYNIQLEDTEPAFFMEKGEEQEDIELMEKYVSDQQEMLGEKEEEEEEEEEEDEEEDQEMGEQGQGGHL